MSSVPREHSGLALACFMATALTSLMGCFGTDHSTPASDAAFDAPELDAAFTDAGDGGLVPVVDAPADTGADAIETGTASDASEAEAAPPTPAVVVTGVPSPYALASDGKNLYWTNFPPTGDAGSVMQVDLATGGVTTLVTTAQAVNAQSLAFDSANVYASATNSIALLSVPIGGGAVTTLASGGYYETSPITVVGGQVVGTQVNSGVWSVPTGGGPPVNYAPQPYGTITGVSDGTSFFWAQYASPNAIRKVPLGASSPTPVNLVTNAADGGNTDQVVNTDYQNLAVDGTNLYWMNASDGTVRAVPKGGGTPVVLASGQGAGYGPKSLATDGVNLYWVRAAPTAIMKMPVGGGVPATLVSGSGVAGLSTFSNGVPSIALDATSLYWLNPPEIMRIAK